VICNQTLNFNKRYINNIIREGQNNGGYDSIRREIQGRLSILRKIINHDLKFLKKCEWDDKPN
jgi:GTP1/Obg family GTP-binding protein